MTASEGSVLRRATGVEASRFAGEYVLLDATGRRLRGLNDSAGKVWELLDGVRTAEEIAGQLAREYAIPAARALPDVLSLLSQLWDRSLIEDCVAPANGRPHSTGSGRP